MAGESRQRALPRSLRIGLAGLLAGLVLAALVSGVASAAPRSGPPATLTHNPLVADLIRQVTTPTLVYELEGLTGERPVIIDGAEYTIATRNLLQTEPLSMATRYVHDWLSETGLDVSFHDYAWGDNQWRNVVAEKRGLVDADRIYIVGAHLDSLPEGPLAPGADDNATGSVAVMMAAKLLAPYDAAYTVRFVLFTGEEYGLLGSDAYAADCAARGEDIRGVINLDMMGYNTGEPVHDLFARSGDDPGAPESRRLAEWFIEVIELYDLDVIPQYMPIDVYPLMGGSDQWSFLERGYPAILVSENYAGNDFNPYYHQTGDTISLIDLEYYAELTRATIGTMVYLGRVMPGGVGGIAGTIYSQETLQPLGGTVVTATYAAYGYEFATAADGAGRYSMTLPAGEHTLAVVSPGTGGYSATVPVTVVADQVMLHDLALGPGSEPPEEERSGDVLSPLVSIGERLLDPLVLAFIYAWRSLVVVLS
jgi:hypothetical protein